MMAQFSNMLGQRPYPTFLPFRAAYLARSTAASAVQWDADDQQYRLWFYDRWERHFTQIWIADVPDDVQAGGYTQEQNTADRAEFEATFKLSGNKNVEPQTTSVELANAPKTSDGKLIFLPNLFPGGVTLYLTGAGDDPTDGRGEGPFFAIASDAAGDQFLEWQMVDWQYLAGGGVTWKGAELGDCISLQAYAPATPFTENATHAGNANVVNPGMGPVLLLPAAGTGTLDLDLTKAVPIPADTDENGVGTGAWDWTKPDTGLGIITPNIEGKGDYHLFSVPVQLARFVNKYPLLGAGHQDITLPAIKPKRLLPQWKMKATLHNAGHAGLQVAWWTTTARIKTIGAGG